jgi:hypothetical protein
MQKFATCVVALLVVSTISGCARGQRREEMQQKLQFENIDTNGDGSISRSEWEAAKAELQSMRRF